MTEQSQPSSGLFTASWALGLAACLCNLLLVLLPFGLLLGILGIILGCVHMIRTRAAHSNRAAGVVLSGVSLLIAAILIGTTISVFWIDPTLL